jgi:tRNA 2-thiouridine synthesizing protein E
MPQIEINGNNVETNDTGFLINIDDWSEAVAEVLAQQDGLVLTQRHWDVVKYLRNEFIDNREHQPNNREMVKGLSEVWGTKTDTKDLFDLFPGGPSKQAGRIAGLPESRRKGGY